MIVVREDNRKGFILGIFFFSVFLLVLPLFVRQPLPQDLTNIILETRFRMVLIAASTPREEGGYTTSYFHGVILNSRQVLSVAHGVTMLGPDRKNDIYKLFIPADGTIKDIRLKKIDEVLDLVLFELREPLSFGQLVISDIFEGEEVFWVGGTRAKESEARYLFFLRAGRATKHLYALVSNNGVMRIIEMPGGWIFIFPGGMGDSGGGVFNLRGELVGIIQKYAELGFGNVAIAVNADIIRKFLKGEN